MTNGGTAGGRGAMSIPDDIMDSLAGDAAQESMARNKLIMEMRRQEDVRRGAEFVNLDMLTEMESGDVDKFLSHARKKIIKRSKPTRTACCAKIGGVLDQILGPAGGEHAEPQGVRDRGADDPTGDADQVAEAEDQHPYPSAKRLGHDNPWTAAHQIGIKVRGVSVHDALKNVRAAGYHPLADEMETHEQRAFRRQTRRSDMDREEQADTDLLNFIAEEFAHYEHDFECKFSDPKFVLNPDPLAEAKFIAGAIKKPGALRAHYNVAEGAEVPVAKAKADYARLQKKAEGEGTLTGDEMKLFKRLQLFLKVLKPAATAKQEEDKNMDASKTAKALSSFMESSHNPYAAAKAGSGKGAPDADKLKDRCYTDEMKTRDDNAEYPTDLKPAKAGNKTVAGAPGKVGTRDKDPGDPIGEQTAAPRRVSNTAKALGFFMEATGQYETAQKKLALKGKDAGETECDDREKQPYGLPPKPAKGERAKAAEKPRYEKGAVPPGDASEKDAAGSRMQK
jgi:hypothetical protein